jgi:hypothetical protein
MHTFSVSARPSLVAFHVYAIDVPLAAAVTVGAAIGWYGVTWAVGPAHELHRSASLQAAR